MKPFTLLLLLLVGCSALPRDPDGTLDRVRAERAVRIGLPAPLQPDERHVAALTRRIAAETGARPRWFANATEPLLADLEAGRLDLVIAPFEAKTPWEARVALAPPVDAAKPDDRSVTLRPAMRSGENRWIMLVERHAHAVAGS